MEEENWSFEEWTDELNNCAKKSEIKDLMSNFWEVHFESSTYQNIKHYKSLFNTAFNRLEDYNSFLDSEEEFEAIRNEFIELIDIIENETKKIFIVHGRDHAMRDAVAAHLGKLKQEYSILEDAHNSGQTVIEKFVNEAAECGYAIILMSADDFGKSKSEIDLKPRARQNVILELGFFLSHVGRENIFILHDRNVQIETPSDFAGIVYATFDEHGAWKSRLKKELKRTGQYVNE